MNYPDIQFGSYQPIIGNALQMYRAGDKERRDEEKLDIAQARELLGERRAAQTHSLALEKYGLEKSEFKRKEKEAFEKRQLTAGIASGQPAFEMEEYETGKKAMIPRERGLALFEAMYPAEAKTLAEMVGLRAKEGSRLESLASSIPRAEEGDWQGARRRLVGGGWDAEKAKIMAPEPEKPDVHNVAGKGLYKIPRDPNAPPELLVGAAPEERTQPVSENVPFIMVSKPGEEPRFVKNPGYVEPNDRGMALGRGATADRFFAKWQEYRARIGSGEELSGQAADEFDFLKDWMSKYSQWAPTQTTKLANEQVALESLIGNPEVPEEIRKIYRERLDAMRRAEEKKGQYLATTVSDTGASSQEAVRVPIPTGGTNEPAPPARGTPLGSKPEKPLPAGIQEDLAQFKASVGFLNDMKQAVQQSSGLVSGAAATAQTYAPELLGANPAAERFVAVLPQFKLTMQAAVKGTPSDADMRSVMDSLPALWGRRGVQLERWNASMRQIGTLLDSAVTFNKGKGVFIPQEYSDLAAALVKGQYDITGKGENKPNIIGDRAATRKPLSAFEGRERP